MKKEFFDITLTSGSRGEDIHIMEYYSQRASEYEKIYQKPERQEDLKKLKEVVSTVFEGRNILEIACGTGYWTQFIAESAQSICAIDHSSKVLKLAKQKDYKKCKISFVKSDVYSLKNVKGNFDGGFFGFWWSHIPKSKVTDFIKTFHSKLAEGALVAMIDNRYIKGNSTPISRTDSEGNTYQIRKLEDGTEYEVLKNFPDEQKLKALLHPYANKIYYNGFEYYWFIKYYVSKS
jgi:demethylmenaquinone methyltransferase/2-methoxy-6-polyprenyl-1,4-benzoquinol methylase